MREIRTHKAELPFFVDGPVSGDSPRYREWRYHVFASATADYENEYFEARFRECGPGTMISLTLLAPRHLANKGIATAMVRLAPRDLELRLFSSSKNFPVYVDEDRTSDADALWNSLVRKGEAKYHPETDRFEYLGWP